MTREVVVRQFFTDFMENLGDEYVCESSELCADEECNWIIADYFFSGMLKICWNPEKHKLMLSFLEEERKPGGEQTMRDKWLIYQEGIEKFYNDFAQVLTEIPSIIAVGNSDYEDVQDPDLLLFDTHFCYEPFDYQGEEFLSAMIKKGYEIVMNFQAEDVILGNVAVKINDKWFAFGQCKNDEIAGPYVMDIWSLKHVLTNLKEMEITIQQALSIETTQKSPERADRLHFCRNSSCSRARADKV